MPRSTRAMRARCAGFPYHRRMLKRFRALAPAALAVSMLTAACGGGSSAQDAGRGASPGPAPSRSVVRTFSDLAKRPLTREAGVPTGAALPLKDYQAKVNKICLDLKEGIPAPPARDTASEDDVAKYSAKLLDSSADAYIAIARLHPPAGREQFFRAGLLKPYFRQLHAAERLYIQIIATKRKDGAQPLLAEAQAAKRDLTIFVAKNGLDRCV